MFSIALTCLGAFEVIIDQQTVTGFPTDKTRALFAYLALESAPLIAARH